MRIARPAPIVPFGVDPYDAVGSFGDIIGILTALLALFRAFRPYRGRVPSIERRIYLARAQTAVVLAVRITLASDAVALGRRPRSPGDSARGATGGAPSPWSALSSARSPLRGK